ncbi:MAG TPA: GNAT family N-acetyltransferase [Labilithrix sp.]|nr:GNAT family N-acetyltransferase [Labilithrix sp.]
MIHVEAVTTDHLPRLRAFFDACANTCFCQYWHFLGTKNEWLDRCANDPETNASLLERGVRTKSPDAQGLVALDESGAVLGWLKLTPRSSVPKLRGLPVYRNLDLGDDLGTYSIGCMLVRPDARGSGVARAMVEAAPRLAKDWGARSIEAYPRRAAEPLHAEEAWQGPEHVFVESGFRAVVDVAPYPVYRKDV